MKKTIQILLLMLFSVSFAQRNPESTFGIFPLFGAITNSPLGNFTDAEIQTQMTQLKNQIGENRGQFRVGFGGIFNNEATLDRNLRLSKANNLSHVVIIALQTHATPASISNIALDDFRNYQWRLDGVNWEGAEGVSDVSAYPVRDYRVVTPSRYAKKLRAEYENIIRTKSAPPIKRQIEKYPGVIVGVNSCIEQEMATGTTANNNDIGDYSPYAITEFRDWLLHKGIYDATNGDYKTEGASAAIVGALMTIAGKQRSPFYDDPTPNNSNGTGVSFNTKFGTSFTTWTLKNWDLTAFPDPITNRNFDPSPTSGKGFTSGGFDAPRAVNINNDYWNAWSWDIQDHSGNYPDGNPTNPAFGFRQTMIRNFVNDVQVWLKDVGIPAELLSAHQLPAEVLQKPRALSSASPIWTGLSKLNGSIGITRYGTLSDANVGKITQYTDNWGIYEWHPQTNPTDNTVLENKTKADLTRYYNANCRILCPFTWVEGAGGLGGNGNAGTYPVKGCGFATGIKSWLNAQPTIAPEINIKQGTTNYTDGSSTYTFNNTLINTNSQEATFTIENKGNANLKLGTLTYNPVAISGSNANQFVLSTVALASVGQNQSTTFKITFKPTSIGSKTATVTVVNDDLDEGFYTFTIKGEGSNALSIIENEFFNSAVTLYPNPVASNVTIATGIDLSEVKISVYSILGTTLSVENIPSISPTNPYLMSMNQLSSGTYFIEVNAKEGKSIKRIVKLN
jgi:hypothetical protein